MLVENEWDGMMGWLGQEGRLEKYWGIVVDRIGYLLKWVQRKNNSHIKGLE